MIKEDQKKNKKSILWIVGVVTFMTLVICILKYTSMKVYANEFNDTFYYGNIINSYKQINSSGYKIYAYPAGTIIFKFDFNNEQYVAICSDRYNIVNNGSGLWGIYRQITTFDNNDNMIGFQTCQFFQMEGYSSDNIVSIDGRDYIIRTMTITEYLEGLPYYYVWSNRMEGPKMILEGIIKGFKNYSSGVNIENVNASIDTSGLEQLVSDSNTIAQNTSTNIATITQDVGDIKNGSGSGSGLNEEEKKLLVRYDLWLVLIFFCVGLHMVRGIIRSIGNRIRKV